MTREQLDEIKKLAEAATPGPWEPYIGVDYGLTMAEYYACGPYHASREYDESASIVGDGKERAEADAAFIAAMRQHAMPLVKALEEAWEALDQVSSDYRMSEAQIIAAIAEVQKGRDEARAEVELLRAEVRKQVFSSRVVFDREVVERAQAALEAALKDGK